MRTPVVANDIQVAHSELERRVPERAASLEQRHSELRSDVEKRLKLEEHYERIADHLATKAVA